MNANSEGRLVAGKRAEEDAAELALRPQTLGDFIGQKPVRDNLGIFITAAKARGEKWPMLTAYDALTAGIFDDAGIPVLLVGDSAGNVVFGYETTIPVTVDELIPLTAAVVRGSRRALVVIDMQRDFVEPGGFGAALGNRVERLTEIVPTVAALLAC